MKAVVFDMDGTLFDSTACVTTAYRDAIRAGCGRECTPDEIVAAYSLGPPAALLAHFLGRPATTADMAVYLASLDDHHDLIRVYAGLREALVELRSGRLPLGVFTGASHEAAMKLLAATELAPFFAVVVGGDQVDRVKPDPHGVLLAASLLDVDPRTSAYVGDSPLDLEAARRAGATAVAAGWGHLYDPAAPCDVTAHTPSEIATLLG